MKHLNRPSRTTSADSSRLRAMSTGTLVVLTLGVASTASAVTIVNDTWADGSRSDPTPTALPTPYSENGVDSDLDGDRESAWFRSGGGTMTVTPGGPLRTTTAAAAPNPQSSSWTTYFTPEDSPVTLGAAGDQIEITWVFTPTGVNTGNSQLEFRIAIVDSPSANRVSAENGPGSAMYAGYALFGNMGQTLGSGIPFALYERSDPSATAPFLSSSGAWAYRDNEEAIGAVGYASGTQYTFTFTATRTLAGELDIAMSMTGGTIGGDGSLNVAYTDASPSTFTFDTFGIRPSSLENTAAQFDTSLFRVDYNPIPEPASLALLALGGVTLIRRRRA